MNGGVAVDGCRGVHVNGFMCVCYCQTDGKYHSSLKVFFIISECVVSCADHYHVRVYVTATGMHFYEKCVGFIRSLLLVHVSIH